MFSPIKTIVFLFLLINVCQRSFADSPVPIVLWHGMGDTCCSPISLGPIKRMLEEVIPDVYVKSLKIGNDGAQEVMDGFFKNVNEQIDIACDAVSRDRRLQNGYNAIGFSQGAQFLRGLVQRCPTPRMLNLISLGGQHQGVFGLPRCGSMIEKFCSVVRNAINFGVYTKHIQNSVVQAEYWHDPLNEDKYKNRSIFLADINNELTINQKYRDNLMNLETLVLVKFTKDTMVTPRESEWFGYYKPGQAVDMQTLQESALYQEDRLGLKEMDKQGKIHFLSVEGDHLHFTDTWFIENIIKKYLS